jgi:hypothetical protein
MAAAAVFSLAACTGPGVSGQVTPPPISRSTATALPAPTSAAVVVPARGSEVVEGGCGASPVYKGGVLPDWAMVNEPKGSYYVVPKPGIALGYFFSGPPLTAGLNANTKILWYVGTPRAGYPLEAEGHPLGASGPTAKFSRTADSWPGEIYPTGPTVPSAGCWHFTLTWHGGDQRAEVDLLFK